MPARSAAALALLCSAFAAPCLADDPPAAAQAITVVKGSGPPTMLTAAEVASLPAVHLSVSFGTEHGPRQAAFDGPLLWTVLDHVHAIDAAKPRDQVRQYVMVTGRDGYTAVVALGEIAPAFEGKQVILAEQMDGQPLGPEHLRIVVPGDQRGGRSVRDIVRIAVAAPDADQH